MKYKFEVCADAPRSCLHAFLAGVDSVELCAGLRIGGITPTAGLVRQVWRLNQEASKRLGRPPVRLKVLVRPREGDFCYSICDYQAMAEDIVDLYAAGADEVVIGGLTPDGALDLGGIKRLLDEYCAGRPVSCHRAFDMCAHPEAALEQLVALGFTSILTSGGASNAYAGVQCRDYQSCQLERVYRKTLFYPC